MAGHAESDACPDQAAVVRAAARTHEIDRYLSALLAPRAARADLIALAAFAGEVGRIRAIASEPMIAAIRRQWWRDALDLAERGDATGHPVADALARAMTRHGLPKSPLVGFIGAQEARPALTAPAAELRGHLARTDGALFALASQMLGGGGSLHGMVEAGGQAYGLARMLVETPSPRPAELGDIARQRLAEVRRGWATVPRHLRPALLPVALVEPYLRALEKPGPGSPRAHPELAPMRRVWQLWRAYRGWRM